MKKIFLTAACIIAVLAAFGQNASFQVDGVQIKNVYAYTSPFNGVGSIPFGHNLNNMSLKIEFWFDDDPELYQSSWDATYKCNLTFGNGQVYNYVELRLNKDVSLGTSRDHDQVIVAMGGWVSGVTITVPTVKDGNTPNALPISDVLLSHMHVRFTWVYDWQINIDKNTPPAITLENFEAATRELVINWAAVTGAVGYDLEWIFLSDGRNPGTHTGDALPFDFKNAVRLRLTENAYRITMAYPKGSLIYRVRAVGKNQNGKTDLGSWSYQPTSPTLSQAHMDDGSGTLCAFYLDENNQLEPDKNWQYSATFVENGKKKEVVNFADGSLRNRQMVTVLSGNALVGETKYDLDGRPALNVLPAPAYFNGLQYYTNTAGGAANASSTNGGFDKNLFFSDSKLDRNTDNPPALPVAQSASATYYSPQNPLAFENKAAIPTANGWVYSQTKYLNDGTNRPIEQSGVGEAFQMNGDHTTRYYYGKPTQTELDRLFGNEAGNQLYYQKNLVVDPNGQVSVSYLDNKGRTIATALAGDKPTQLDAVPNNLKEISATLFTGQKQPNNQGTIESSYTFMVPTPNTEVTLNYALTPTELEGCSGTQDCRYDIYISITDQNGLELQRWEFPSVNGLADVNLMHTFQDVGSYTITRTVAPTAGSLAGFIQLEEDFLMDNMEDNDCVPYFLNTDIDCPGDDCQSKCEGVYKSVNAGIITYYDDAGNKYKLINNGTQYQNLSTGAIIAVSPTDPVSSAIAACVAACNSAASQPVDLNPCDLILNKFIVDLSPGGQYFDNTAGRYLLDGEDGTIVVSSNEGSYSVVDLGDEYEPEGWLNAIIPNYIDLINTANGTSFTNRADLINNWNPVYAQALLLYHPEYYAYEFFCLGVGGECDNNSAHSVNQTTIYGYLNLMYADGSNQHAVNHDLFNPTGLTPNGATGSPTNNYSDYIYLDGLLYPGYTTGPQDPVTLCTSSGSLGEHVYNFVNQRLQEFIEIPGYPGSYYSVWFVLDNPLDFHEDGNSPDPAIQQIFQAFHGNGQNPHLTDYLTEYEIFRAIYTFYRDWAIYDYFDNHYIISKLYPPYFTDAAQAGEYILWDYDDPGYPGAPTPLMAIDAILSSSNLSSLVGFHLNFPRNLVYDLAAQGPTNAAQLAQSSAFATNNPASGQPNPAMKCMCENIVAQVKEVHVTFDPFGLAQFLSNLGFTYTPQQIQDIYNCADSQNPDYTFLINNAGAFIDFACTPALGNGLSCEEIQMQRNLDLAYGNYLRDLDYYLYNLQGTLNTTCLSNFETRETVTITYQLNEYHYTLYYYDQAGNLVKTVPPKGVMPIDDQGTLDQVAIHRYNELAAPFTVPDHKMATRYVYNSLNQLVKQNTPDGGITQFWYDTEGRLVVSQNAKQAVNTAISYSIYDDLSRIVEAGELQTASPTDFNSGNFLDNARNWITTKTTSTRRDVVHTYYTTLPLPFINIPTFTGTSANRNRVVASMAYDVILNGAYDWVEGAMNNSNNYQYYTHATYYSYDIHGNVQELAQDYPTAPDRTKRMRYDYDLLSGNVNQVAYQPNQPDAFYHRYTYDADNRITTAQTSVDGVTWTEDANYTYYPHGPLARTELGGQTKVQGIDYAYTLQGWLKYINGGSIGNEDFDIGLDGKAGTANADFLPNVFNYVLGYYTSHGNDFASISPAQNGFEVTMPVLRFMGGNFDQTNRELFNGNISYTISGLPTSLQTDQHLINLYTYDQLNRITAYQAYKDGVGLVADNQIVSYNKSYHTTYAYDPNGNITHLTRTDNNGPGNNFDDISYTYDNIGAANPTNRLHGITDAEGANPSLGDIGARNYTYDEIGNLIQDGGQTITWTAQGKVKSVDGTLNDLNFTYDAMGNRVGKQVIGSQPAHYRYVRDASGNVMAVYNLTNSNGQQADEHHVYGSSRLGIVTNIANQQPKSSGTFGLTDPPLYSYTYSCRVRGYKAYELTNHLGNVMVTLPDVRLVSIDATSTALNLNQNNKEFVALPQGYSNQSVQNVTLSAWVRTTEGGSTYNSNWSILDFDNANYYAFYVRGDNGKVGFSFCNNQGSSTTVRHLSSNTAVNDGRWHHIAVVFGDKTNPNNYTDVKFYVDGQLDNHSYNATWGPTIGKPNTSRYGFIGDGSKATSPYNLGMRYKQYYNGSIDELAYWHRSLTAAEIQDIYTKSFQDLSATELQSIQAWYSFTNQTTAVVTDNSANGQHGTAYKDGNTTPIILGTTQRITASSAIADVLSYTDYYPFGMPLPGRQLTPGSYRYGFNGMEKDGEEWSGNAANQLDFGARIYDPRIGRWLAIDPLSIKYPSISPYAFVANNVINAVDPDGKKIIFVNGHFQDNAFGDWFNIGRKGGREYWSDKFISGAQEFFNDKGATQFLDGSSSVGFDMDGEDRYNAGYEWAKANYETLITDLEEGEVFNMVTSSEGAAHGAGVAAYLIEKGHTVKTVVHLSPDEGNDFDTPTQPETYQLDFEDDWVTGNERVDGVDKRGTVKENGSTPHGRHRSNTVWDKVKDLKTVQTQENWDSNGNTFTSQVKGTTPNDTKFIEIDEKPIKNE